MKLENAADAAARAWLDAVKLLAGTQPQGYFRESPGGTAEMVTGAPFPALNGVASAAREPSAAEIASLTASPRLNGYAWSIHLRGDTVNDEIVRIADSHGLAMRQALPLMVKEIDAPPPAARARRITSADSTVYQRTMAAGFEAPEPLFAIFTDPALLADPRANGYLLEVDGVPVATSFGVLSGDVVGVFNVAVPPPFRRKGYGRLATSAVLADAYASGARLAYLHSSADGYALYQQMGFELAEHWSVFAPA